MKNSFKKFSKTPLFISAVFFLLSCFAFIFLYKNIQDNNRIFEEGEAEWQREASKKGQIESLDNLLQTVEMEKILLEDHFIQSSDVVPFLDSVEKLAPRTGVRAEVTLVDISPSGTSLSVGVRATGTFESLYKFLTLLENSSYQLEFTAMSMERVGGGAASSTNVKVGEWLAVFKIKLLSFVK